MVTWDMKKNTSEETTLTALQEDIDETHEFWQQGQAETKTLKTNMKMKKKRRLQIKILRQVIIQFQIMAMGKL